MYMKYKLTKFEAKLLALGELYFLTVSILNLAHPSTQLKHHFLREAFFEPLDEIKCPPL